VTIQARYEKRFAQDVLPALPPELPIESLRQPMIRLGILTGAVLALTFVGAFLAWLVDLAKVPIVSYVQTHMAIMRTKDSPANMPISTPGVAGTTGNTTGGNLNNRAASQVNSASVASAEAKTFASENAGKQEQAKAAPVVVRQQLSKPQALSVHDAANPIVGLPAAPVMANTNQRIAVDKKVPAKALAENKNAASTAKQALVQEKAGKQGLTIDPAVNPQAAADDNDRGYKPLVVNTDAETHPGDGSFRIEMAGEKGDSKRQSAQANKSVSISAGKPASPSARSKYRNDDMATYNRLLADYFSHPGADGAEPPSFEEWIKNGKTNF
jgi:hypothetical protein